MLIWKTIKHSSLLVIGFVGAEGMKPGKMVTIHIVKHVQAFT